MLDEATSDLDHESEMQVIDYISTIPCTKIIISHKDEILRITDTLKYVDGAAMQPPCKLLFDRCYRGQKAAFIAPGVRRLNGVCGICFSDYPVGHGLTGYF